MQYFTDKTSPTSGHEEESAQSQDQKKMTPEEQKKIEEKMKAEMAKMKGGPKGMPSAPDLGMKPDPKTMQLPGKPTRTKDGIIYADIKVGTGETPRHGDKVTVHYTGWLVDGTKFDSSYDRGKPSEFAVDQVIKGWTEMLLTMKPGGKRKVIIPPDLAYGDQGSPGGIPPKATLVFEIELISVAKG
jgi:FKBP-type peptidyl-prolyl cis-trans isomerase